MSRKQILFAIYDSAAIQLQECVCVPSSNWIQQQDMDTIFRKENSAEVWKWVKIMFRKIKMATLYEMCSVSEYAECQQLKFTMELVKRIDEQIMNDSIIWRWI